MQTQESTVTFSALKGVDAAKLERELASMWAESSSATEEGGAAAGVTRACVLNLVVYTEGAEEREEVDALLDSVTERHPCRALVLIADRAAEESRLEAFISTRCQMSKGGGKQICGEQVTIEAAGEVVSSAATAVAPLLVPDVPVFLWWKDIPHYEDKLFNRLAELSDRVVIDSASFDNPHFDVSRLARILEERRGSLNLSDLNWGRLTSWRSLVASFWDVADYRDALSKIESVRIEYDPPDRAPGEIAPKALLAVGWLASCLGWEVEGSEPVKAAEGERSFLLRAGERTLEVSLRATEDAAGRDGMITALTIRAEGGDEFRVALRLDESKLETGARVGGASHEVTRVLGYEARTEGERLSKELEILARDVLYERAVTFAARLLETVKD
ncbi:MAG TPA: glucose-6-phosphate dehydrogenase assembly protein OpcA [Pyrinomonadaceae bacterium]|nr:glucose-6-phosphate dehydrogenase assembly protein OpcA [Pyrinomonadaceae bacterium]